MNNFIKVVSTIMAERGEELVPGHNSVLTNLVSTDDSPGASLTPLGGSVAGKLATVISTEVGLIRGIYNPFVNKYIGLVNDILGNNPIINPATTFKVLEFKLPEILEELSYRKVLVETPRAVIQIPESPISINLQDKELQQCLTFGVSALDTMLADITVKYTMSEIGTMLDKYLSNVSGSNPNINNLGLTTTNNLDEVIMLLAVVTKLSTDPVGMSSVPVAALQLRMKFFRQELENHLRVALNNHESFGRRGVLVLKVTSNTITVVSEVYEKFLVNGTADSLLGIITLDKDKHSDYTSLESVIGAGSELEDKYRTYHKYEQFRIASRAPVRYREVYILALRELFNSIPEDIVILNNNQLGDYVRSFDARIKSLGTEVQNVPEICRTLIGETFLSETNYTKFTKNMIDYSNSNSELTPEEAATLASLDMVVDYLMMQVTTNPE